MNKQKKAENKLGTFIPSLEENIGCLLWMDDVVLISQDPEELQTKLDITNALLLCFTYKMLRHEGFM